LTSNWQARVALCCGAAKVVLPDMLFISLSPTARNLFHPLAALWSLVVYSVVLALVLAPQFRGYSDAWLYLAAVY
jgi:hypothetical protein